MNDFPKIKPLGERSILIELEPEISEKQLEKLLFYKKLLQKKYAKQKIEVINTYNSLLIYYDFNIENVYDEILTLSGIISSANITKNTNKKIFHIPVCYDVEFGLDLEYISQKKGISISEIIRLHTAPVYTVYFIGFLPGFLYLGGLDKKLQISRKETPRLEVQNGAVGIGENQTGIYPQKSPGGWQILGNSPVQLFDKNKMPPCEILAGDKIKFCKVSKSEFEEIKIGVSKNDFSLKIEEVHGRN